MSLDTRLRHALLDPEQPPPAELCAWNGADVTRRFNVYRNNVMVSLIDALADTFEVTQQLVGRRFFRAMAREYVPDHLPDSPVLALYGEDFPDFIARFPPTAGLPYLPDLARLEWLRVRACHAADAAPLAHETITAWLAEPERIADTRLHLHPSLGLIESAHAVVSLWAAHQGDGDVANVAIAEPEQALVLRAKLEVEVIPLPPGAAALLRPLQAGHSLGQAQAAAGLQLSAATLEATLATLLASSALIGLSAPRGQTHEH
jgi:hypothetical protein